MKSGNGFWKGYQDPNFKVMVAICFTDVGVILY